MEDAPHPPSPLGRFRVSPRAAGYLVAIGSVAVATFTRWLLEPLVGDAVPFIVFVPAVLLAAWYGGRGPALVSLLLSALSAAYFFLPPANSLAITDAADQLALLLFLVLGIAIALLSDGQRRAQQRAVAAQRAAEAARTALAQSEQRLSRIVEMAAEGIVVIDAGGRYQQINAAAERILGVTRDEMIGRLNADPPYRRFTLEGEPLGEVPAIAEVAASGDHVFRHEYQVERHDGTRVVLLRSLTALRDPAGTFLGVVSTFTDRTEQFTAAAALAASERRYRELFENANDLLYTLDMDGIVTDVNQMAERVLGYRRDQLIGMTVDQLVQPSQLPAMQRMLERKYHGVPLTSYELTVITAGGAHRLLEVSSRLITQAGETIGIQGSARDITERREEERRARLLAESTEMLVAAGSEPEAVLEAIAHSVADTLGDACDLRLRSEDGMWLESLGAYHTDPALHPLVREIFAEPLRIGEGIPGTVAATGRPIAMPVVDETQLRAALKPEHVRLLEHVRIDSLVMVPLRAGSGVIGTLGVARTTAGRPYNAADQAFLESLADRIALSVENARLYRATHEQLNRQVTLNAQLQETATARDEALAETRHALIVRDEFLSSVSHDLRTPLATISGLTQLLRRQAGRRDTLESARIDEPLAAVERAATRMSALVNDLLDLSRIETGRPLELLRQAIDLVPLIRLVAQDYQRSTPDHLIRVETTLATLVGVWDAERLERALGNLVGNAIKFSPAGGDVTVTLTREGELACVTVTDRGVGIPTADLPHIFERFHRSSNVTGRIKGSGVGLATTRQIIEQHGGTIAIATAEGQGTTVTLRLPLGNEDNNQQGGAREPDNPGG